MKHFKKHHKGFPPGFEDAKIYICDECPEEFLTPYNLANHKTAVHKFRDEKFVCDRCDTGKEFDKFFRIAYSNHTDLKPKIWFGN